MHAEERQARLERESKCKSEESDKAHRSVPTSCLDPLESKLGFSHMSIFSQSWAAARTAPNGVKKGGIFLPAFRCLNHTASSQKSFSWVSEGPSSLKETQTVKKISFVDDRLRGHHPWALKMNIAPAPKPHRNSGSATDVWVCACARARVCVCVSEKDER